MIPLLSLNALRWVFIWVILLSSVTTLIDASGVAGTAPNGDIAILASMEIAAVGAFATNRWRSVAALALVLIFAIALVVSAVQGEFAARFVYFAASAVFLQRDDDEEFQLG